MPQDRTAPELTYALLLVDYEKNVKLVRARQPTCRLLAMETDARFTFADFLVQLLLRSDDLAASKQMVKTEEEKETGAADDIAPYLGNVTNLQMARISNGCVDVVG